jgi:hypothetical protein
MSSSSSSSDKPKARLGGVDFTAISDRQIGDKRFERERAAKIAIQEKGVAVLKESKPAMSSTFDAVIRMAAGLESRTIADKINDSNRPTWEQYKKDNEDKLNMAGQEARKMAEYRRELDRERELKLSQGLNHKKKSSNAISDSEDDDGSSDSGSRKEKKKKHKKEKKKHHKKDKKKHKVRDLYPTRTYIYDIDRIYAEFAEYL